MMMIEITEQKLNKATDYAEKMLKYGGMLMQCLTEWEEENGMGERRGSYGNRGGYGRYSQGGVSMGNRYGDREYIGMKDDEDWDDYEDMGERRDRRRRDSRGRYM